MVEATGEKRVRSGVIEIRMLMTDAVKHDASCSLEEARALEELLGRIHRARSRDLLAIERIS